ncbi:MAG: ATP-binding protein [Deltaproteobacteria bacterium]|nr:ATP-binding protein [Deltaproteobacteria bacterium]
MTNQEWLGAILGWAVSFLRGDATPADLARLERLLSDAAAREPLAWDVLRRRLRLSRTEQTTLSLLVAVELSLDISAMVAALNKDPNRPAIDVAVLQRTVYAAPDAAARFVTELSNEGALLRYRLVEVANERRPEETPFLLRQLRPTRRLIELVHGAGGIDSELKHIASLQTRPSTPSDLRLPTEIRKRAIELAKVLDRTPGSPVLVLSGPDGAGRRSLFQDVAHELGRASLLVNCARLPFEPVALGRICQTLLREALLADAIPVLHDVQILSGDPIRADRQRLVDDYLVSIMPGVIGATGPHDDSKPATFGRGLAVVDIPPPAESDRAILWRRHLGPAASEDDVSWAASRYTVTGGTIERAARTAVAEVAARGTALERADLHKGIRSTLDAKLSAVGRRISTQQTWANVVLPEDVLEEVREIIARVKHRGLVYDHWGMGKKIGKGLGVSALFSGPPGTGKTMIAGVIAGELGLDLYQVDLSQIVSKYIGETEKNLAGLFDAAEAGHAVLLFDEADSMFAKRTEVKSSNDRYANLEVNFLLQRMESFSGISILTTNLESSIDEAFKRRLAFRIAFDVPEEDERAQLWRTLLPDHVKNFHELGLSELARRFAMSGGYIKNAVLRAAFFAADANEPLGEAHLRKAAALEYAAMGKVMHSSR